MRKASFFLNQAFTVVDQWSNTLTVGMAFIFLRICWKLSLRVRGTVRKPSREFLTSTVCGSLAKGHSVRPLVLTLFIYRKVRVATEIGANFLNSTQWLGNISDEPLEKISPCGDHMLPNLSIEHPNVMFCIYMGSFLLASQRLKTKSLPSSFCHGGLWGILIYCYHYVLPTHKKCMSRDSIKTLTKAQEYFSLPCNVQCLFGCNLTKS